LIIAGDPAQAINGWTGAIDAMDKFGDKFTQLILTQSFRFSPVIAEVANIFLSLLGDFRILGYDKITSTTGPVDVPHAILCRTNAGVINAAMSSVAAERKTAMPEKQADEIKAIAKAATQLIAGSSCDYEPFAIFQNWEEVKEYVENDPSGADLKATVNIITKYGPGELIRLIDSLVSADMADTMVSTVHKTKGLEFKTVELAYGDFPEPKPNADGTQGEIIRDDLMMYYVAVTRAMECLDWTALQWITGYLASPGDSGE
jgi:superfamily I DNA/RNA helicase